MSDDEMEIDSGPTDKITFSTAATEAKGKRSAANLPIQAGDTLPWVEKYRPASLDDVSGHEDILQTINRFVEQNKLPHLLFYGPPGTGKTSTILALARKIYDATSDGQLRHHVLELNASDDRGIDVVRDQIKTFASTKQIFSSFATQKDDGKLKARYKLIVLDEADAMTSTAQNALRRIMEKYTANVRFCIIANYTHKLNAALLSRCTRFRFSPLKPEALRKRVDHVIECEGVRIQDKAIDSLVRLARGDMRRALNVLQACFAASTPLDENGVAMQGPDVVREEITEETIYECVAAPQPSDIGAILKTLLEDDITTALINVNRIKTLKGLALSDILLAVGEELSRVDARPAVKVEWLAGLAEVEWRVGSGGSEGVQTGGMCGVVRQGVELMQKR